MSEKQLSVQNVIETKISGGKFPSPKLKISSKFEGSLEKLENVDITTCNTMHKKFNNLSSENTKTNQNNKTTAAILKEFAEIKDDVLSSTTKETNVERFL